MTDAQLADLVAAGVAAALGLAAPTARVDDAATAAVAVLRLYLFPPPAVDPPLDLPAGADVVAGLTVLGVRIYQDPASPAGVLGSDAYIGPMIPEDLLTHVVHYFAPYKRAWGIA